MIGIVDVEVQAANPQMPLCPFVAFVGSPSSVRVRNVPGNIGSWNITKVYVSANYPDNSIQSRECTRVGEIYVGTLPACNAVGKGANGFVVSADGVDENGNAVTGYVLGKGDLEILDADGAITPGVTTHYVHGLDEQPSDPHEYDIYKDGDTWKIYFDGAWEAFAGDIPAPSTATPAMDGTGAAGTSEAYARGDHVHPSDTSKQNALTSQQLANIAAVSDALSFDATHTYAAGDPVVYNGTLYTFTATHTGAWTGSDVSAVDIIARLAGKLDKSGGTMTGPLTIVRSGDNIKFDGSTIRFNDEDGSATGGTISGTEGGGDVTLPTYSGTLALTADIPYTLTTKTITNGAVSLDDRASNAVTISATLSPNKLTINFPTAPTGKLRDFAMRLNIAAGVTAPEIAWPQGVTLENNGGEVPEIADGGTGGSSTILYFSESENNGTTAKFTVKGETLTAITQV